jgi:hypothetical protein
MEFSNRMWDQVGRAWQHGLAVLKTAGCALILLSP